MTVMFGDFDGEHIHVSNGTADALLKSLGHPGLGWHTNGSMPVADARRLIGAHTGEKHEYHEAFVELVVSHEKAGKETLEWG